jgi:gas vesicle protein
MATPVLQHRDELLEHSKSKENEMTRGSKWANTFSAFAVGLGIGTALGVLFAPQSGEDTRDYLLQSAKDGVNGVVAAGQKITRRAQEGFDEAADRVRHATDVGERAYREAKSATS